MSEGKEFLCGVCYDAMATVQCGSCQTVFCGSDCGYAGDVVARCGVCCEETVMAYEPDTQPTKGDADFIQSLAYNTGRNLTMAERSTLERVARAIRTLPDSAVTEHRQER